MKKIRLLIGFIILVNLTMNAQWTTITNGLLWKDDNGNAVQAHGSGYIKVGDTWYMVGEDRNSGGVGVNMYSSKDLVTWTFENKIISQNTCEQLANGERFIERPKIIYNEKTKKYVVWLHYEGEAYAPAEAGVFYCDKINGNYSFHKGFRPFGNMARDCNLFVDDDGTAYFIAAANHNADLIIYKLTEDYLDVEEEVVTLWKGASREAPVIVKKDGYYYLITSGCTGWEPNQAQYAFSKSLASGWSDRRNIGNSIAFDTQPTSVLKVEGSEGTTYVFVGDRWQDPGLAESKTIMFPVKFDNGDMTFDYTRQWDLNITTGQWRATPREDAIPKTDWKVCYASSEETASIDGKASNTFDGNLNSYWHSRWSGSEPVVLPHEIQIDMAKEYEISSFLCIPRQDHMNGLIRSYQLFFSQDGKDWGQPVAGGSWMSYQTEITFKPVKARYFRLVVSEGVAGHVTIAEIEMFKKVSDSYTPVELTPYASVDYASWQKTNNIAVPKGGDVKLRVSPTDGSWLWYDPNNKIKTGSEFSITNFDFSDIGKYTAMYTDPYTAGISTMIFTADIVADIDVAKAELKEKIDNAKAILDTNGLGNIEFTGSINAAQAIYDSSMNAGEIYLAINALEEAINKYKYLNASTENPVDMTLQCLQNPSFEGLFNNSNPEGWRFDNVLSGWIDIKQPVEVPQSSTAGVKSLSIWADRVKKIDVYQIITLPKGSYELRAAMRTGTITDQHVYVTIDDETKNSAVLSSVNKWEELNVKFVVEEDNTAVRIGAISSGNGSNSHGWFYVDDFKLFCLGSNSSPVSVENQLRDKEMVVYAIGSGAIVKNKSSINKRINVYSGTGQLIKSQFMTSNEVFIPLASGFYIIEGKKIIIP